MTTWRELLLLDMETAARAYMYWHAHRRRSELSGVCAELPDAYTEGMARARADIAIFGAELAYEAKPHYQWRFFEALPADDLDPYSGGWGQAL